jgi:UDP-N-acetylglucosamine 2-epimerase (non-hydrolysing)
MGYFDYLHLQKNALCVLSDSGTISEESSILDFPAITIRDSMERPELIETGGISMCGLESDSILRGIKFQIENRSAIPAPLEYQVMNFSQRVYQFIESTAPRVAQWQGLRGH